MKKLLLGCFFAVMCTGLFAGSAEDAMFDDFVKGARQNLQSQGGDGTVYADKAHRIVYLALSIPATKAAFTPEKIRQAKKVMMKPVQDDRDAIQVFKTLKLRIVTTYITTDNDIVTISYSYKDL
ncbi:MAG: hypothetical protein J5806_09785 [Lentisphaeria bacterium]|nr:hypothetical protein [Lentisphaeria bacterium]